MAVDKKKCAEHTEISMEYFIVCKDLLETGTINKLLIQ